MYLDSTRGQTTVIDVSTQRVRITIVDNDTLGVATRQAAYANGSDSNDLVFSYAVAGTDGDDRGGISGRTNSLTLSGGTIRFMHTDPAEQVNAALAHAPQGAMLDHKVDTAKPTLESPMVVSTTNTLTLAFSEDLNTTAPVASAFTDRNVDTRPLVPVGVVFDSHLYTVEEGMTVSVTVWLDRDPERTRTIPIWKTYDGGVSFTDFTFPSEVTFTSGEIFKKLTFTTTQDQQDENGERMGFEIRDAAPAVTPGFPRRSLPSRLRQHRPPHRCPRRL